MAQRVLLRACNLHRREDLANAKPDGLTLGLIARGTLVVIGIWALAAALWIGRDVVFIAFFAVLVASLLSIPVSWLQRLGLPRAVSAPLVLLLALVVVGLSAYFFWPLVQEQILLLQKRLPAAGEEAMSWLQRQYDAVSGTLGGTHSPVMEQLRRRAAAEAGRVVGGALPLLNTIAGALFGTFIIVFSGLFMAIEPRLYARGLALLVPRSARRDVMEALVAVGDMLRKWMLGTMIAMLTIGILTTLGLWAMGVPAALVLGVIAGILEFIPYYGPILSAVPAIAIALTVSPVKALWVAVLYTAIQQSESAFIQPLIMRGVVELPPALTLLWSALMAVLFGFLGLLLAVPLLAAAKVMVERLYVEEVTQVS